jgi:hypothetical protein
MFARLSASQRGSIESFLGTPAASHSVANHRTLRKILNYLPKSNLKSARAIHGDFRSAVNEYHPRYKRGDTVTIREDIRSEHRFDDYLDPIYILDVLTRGRGYVTLAFHTGAGEMTYGPRLKDTEIHSAKKTENWLEIFSPFMQTRREYHREERAAYPRGTGVMVEVSEYLRKMLLEKKGIGYEGIHTFEFPRGVYKRDEETYDFPELAIGDVSNILTIPWRHINYEPGARVGYLNRPIEMLVDFIAVNGQHYQDEFDFATGTQVTFLQTPILPNFTKRISIMLDDATNLEALETLPNVQPSGASGGARSKHKTRRRRKRSKSRS